MGVVTLGDKYCFTINYSLMMSLRWSLLHGPSLQVSTFGGFTFGGFFFLAISAHGLPCYSKRIRENSWHNSVK